ncbi:hypothetical protein GCM10023085_50360 [Actinomadura viridis]|uniref:Lipoprotein n=1 Tax=Actinomadura viridis TaxID=58110 RepID=A0A931DR00_9ACTN|nr:hypothetical protein [Actinomadura viridis]MBG6092382.1 hypothetical protein [Actinomadura viridis]
MPKTRSLLIAMTVLVAGLGLSACSSKRWCEHDATDTRVSKSYCEKNTPGYEWESDSKKKTKKKTKKH